MEKTCTVLDNPVSYVNSPLKHVASCFWVVSSVGPEFFLVLAQVTRVGVQDEAYEPQL